MKHEGRTYCCNHKFQARDIQGRLMTQMEAFGKYDPHLYGGNAERFAKTQCPECGTKYIMWMKRQSPNFRVLTITKVEDEPEAVEEEIHSEDEPEAPKRRGRKPQMT